jgi:hypothetical protein
MELKVHQLVLRWAIVNWLGLLSIFATLIFRDRLSTLGSRLILMYQESIV